MKRTFKWGIAGPGWVANRVASGLKELADADLHSVCSARFFEQEGITPPTAEELQASIDRATAFASEHGIGKVCSSYREMISDPELDIVYIAAINPYHQTAVLQALEAGKSVVCEKPFALNGRQAKEMVDMARAKGLFLMEAIWSRFVPVMEDVRAWLTAGEIGEIRMLTADMGFQFQHEDLTTRHYNRLLGGGSLLDLGVYMISFATSVLGNEPVEIHGNALVGTSGVDEQTSISLRFPGGQLASLMVSFLAESPHDACIIGTKGMIRIPCVANGASTATLVREYKLTGEHTTTEVASRKVAGFGYQYEAAEVMRCLRAGLTESPLMPLDETLAIARIMDALRKQWQLVFPGDDA